MQLRRKGQPPQGGDAKPRDPNRGPAGLPKLREVCHAKSSKIIAAAAIAVLAAAGGTAFTATGVATSGNAAAAQFVGGTVSQAVTGATLSDIAYTYADTTNKDVDGITLTFADDLSLGKAVTASPAGGAGGTFACEAVTAAKTSACTFVPTSTEAPFELGYTGLTSMAINVASSQ